MNYHWVGCQAHTPFHYICSHVHVSRFGVHQSGKWCLITDSLHLPGNRMNDGIPPHLCSLSNVTMDDAIQSGLQLRRKRHNASKDRH